MSGGDGSKTSEEEILRALDSHYAPAVGTSDIADAVGVTRQAVDSRLRKMEQAGLVEKYKVGRALVWWMTTEGRKKIYDVAD